jgi:hypothetical protein
MAVAGSVDSTAAGGVSVRDSSTLKDSGVGGRNMSHLSGFNKIPVVRVAVCSALIAMLISAGACRRKPDNAAVGTTGEETQTTFASPAEAGTALHDAAKSGDQVALAAMFGPDMTDVLFSGDPVKDKNALTEFVLAYETMNRWGKIKGEAEMLYVGGENFPFPVPLLQTPEGRWYFDTAGGADEILARRIGRDELVAIAATAALANAQQDYFNGTHAGGQAKQYAQKFASDEGQQNGLYWPASSGRTQSPLGRLGDFAKDAGYPNAGGTTQPFYGYNFRILTKQGNAAKGGAKDYIVNGTMTDGFAILAYPAEYQDSGIMTFLVGTDGIVYEKDLGQKTVDTAVAMTEYNPGDGWKPVNRRQSGE